MFNNCPEIMDVCEVAEELCVGRNRVYELLNTGELKGLRIGHIWKIPKESLIEFVKRNANLI